MLAPRLADMSAAVALRKESVDRNLAWHCIRAEVSYVALRKESVDRNVPGQNLINGIGLVALRKESVDRNRVSAPYEAPTKQGRSPQGERG